MTRDGRPVDPQTRARVVELMNEGTLGRNAIARETGISGATVTKIASEEGHEFDWSKTELAVKASRIRAEEIRERLAQASLLRAFEMLDAMDAPTELVQWSAGNQWTDGGWKRITLDGPTTSDLRNLATVYGIMVQRAGDLMKQNAGTVRDDAVSYLDDLRDLLDVAARALEGTDGDTDPTSEPTMQSRESLLAEMGEPS